MSGRATLWSPSLHRALAACVLVLLACEVWIALTRQFNWDEYLFLGKVYRHGWGDIRTPFQTFHVQLFGWLRGLGDIHRELALARLTMVAAQAVTCASIFVLSRRFTATGPALIAAIAYLACGTTLAHGASFRADPLAAALAMAALAVVAARPLRLANAYAATLLTALALLVTIKAIFFAPAWIAFGLAGAFDQEQRNWIDRRVVGGVMLGAITAGAVFLLHLYSLGDAEIARGAATIDSAGDKVLFDAGFIPQGRRVLYAVSVALPQALGILAAVALLIYLKARGRIGSEFWLLAAAASPLLSLLFYRNAYLYFFPFIVPSAMVLIAWIVERLASDRRLLAGYLFALGLTAAIGTERALSPTQQVQREVVAAVRQIFPEPVYVIDRNHMIADFPREMFLMSTWGLEDYQGGPPFVEDYLRRRTVPLLVVNSRALEDALGLSRQPDRRHRLQEADRRILRENYLPHWGPIWVAGRRFEAAAEPRRFSILVPGRYTLEGGAAVLDGARIEPCETLRLDRGQHTISFGPTGTRTLRWGDHLPKPDRAAPTVPIYQTGGEV